MISSEEQYGDYLFIAVSDIGINHRLNTIPNQDAVLFHYCEDNFILAVSDGVGSCVHAELGARYAVEAAKKCFQEILDGALNNNSISLAEHIIEFWKAEIGENHPDEYCATLKAAFKINRRLLMFSIGDGILAMTSKGFKVISKPDSDLFANQTKCFNSQITVSDFWIREYILDYEIPFTVFACTDGIANSIQEGRELELVQEIDTGISAENLKAELEALVADISEYSSDDKTIGVVRYERKNAKSNR